MKPVGRTARQTARRMARQAARRMARQTVRRPARQTVRRAARQTVRRPARRLARRSGSFPVRPVRRSSPLGVPRSTEVAGPARRCWGERLKAGRQRGRATINERLRLRAAGWCGGSRMYCKQCAEEVPGDSAYCPFCRTDLRDVRRTPSGITPPPGPSAGGSTPAESLGEWATSLPTSDIAAFEPGRLVAGRYEVHSLLGQGGMGAVYRVTDRELGREVRAEGDAPAPDAPREGRRAVRAGGADRPGTRASEYRPNARHRPRRRSALPDNGTAGRTLLAGLARRTAARQAHRTGRR